MTEALIMKERMNPVFYCGNSCYNPLHSVVSLC